MEFARIVSERRSVSHFDPDHTISDDELKSLFEQVLLSPSSFNLQNWRFVVVRDAEMKAGLRRAAHGQEQVETASATIVVVGKLNGHVDAAMIFASAPEAHRERMVSMIEGFYANNPALQRDEAIRSGSLAAMTLMYAAYDMGYATGPMIGFDPNAVSELVGLDENYIPVMLITIGKQAEDSRERSTRLPLGELVRCETLDGPGLA